MDPQFSQSKVVLQQFPNNKNVSTEGFDLIIDMAGVMRGDEVSAESEKPISAISLDQKSLSDKELLIETEEVGEQE